MKKKIIGFIICIMILLLGIIPSINSQKVSNEQNKDTVNFLEIGKEKYDEGFLLVNLDNPDAFGYPNDDTPISVYGTELFGKDWDADREMWRYRFRFDWYQAKRGEPFGDSGWDEWPYVVLQVDLSIEESGIVPQSGNDFCHGGWHVHEHNTGDFEELATAVCTAVLGSFPIWYSLAFTVGAALAKALRDAPPEPEYTWQGQQVYEGSGFYQYDCYVRPNTNWEIKFNLDFWGSSVDRLYQSYRMWWRWKGTSPSGPAKLKLTPESYDFGEVEVDETSSEKKFILENIGGLSAINVERKQSGSSDFIISGFSSTEELFPGHKTEIYVKFRPTSEGRKTGTLKIECDNCDDVSARLSGYGKPKARINIRNTNLLIASLKKIPLIKNNLLLFRTSNVWFGA